MDISSHGDAEERKETNPIIELKKAMEEGDIKVLCAHIIQGGLEPTTRCRSFGSHRRDFGRMSHGTH